MILTHNVTLRQFQILAYWNLFKR